MRMTSRGRFVVAGAGYRRISDARRTSVLVQVGRDDPRLQAIHSALAPYAWERLSTEMLARRVLGALDRYWLHEELARVCGALEPDTEVEPAGWDDERVRVLAHALDESHWRSLALAVVCRQALATLDAWRQERQWLDIELTWLLDSGG
jgi:hypothetical protein